MLAYNLAQKRKKKKSYLICFKLERKLKMMLNMMPQPETGEHRRSDKRRIVEPLFFLLLLCIIGAKN